MTTPSQLKLTLMCVLPDFKCLHITSNYMYNTADSLNYTLIIAKTCRVDQVLL